MPLGGQVPAVQKELDLIRRERPDHEDIGLSGQRARDAVDPGSDHEVVTRVSGDLALDPIGHSEAVVDVRNLIKAIEQDHALAAAELALPPAAWFLTRPGAGHVSYDVGQRDRWIGDDQLGVPAQREQDGDAPLAPASGPGQLGAAAGRVGEQGALPASRLAEQREDHGRAAIEKLGDRMPFRRVFGRLAERGA